jgi:hypothetical protein
VKHREEVLVLETPIKPRKNEFLDVTRAKRPKMREKGVRPGNKGVAWPVQETAVTLH